MAIDQLDVFIRGRRRVNFDCTIGDCDRPAKTRQLCQKHYTRWHRYGDPLHVPKRKVRTCELEGCDRKHMAKGFCHMHYQRWAKHGDPAHSIHELSYEDRFWAKVDKVPGGCWMWTGAICPDGYGKFHFHKKTTTAHRASLILDGQNLIEGLVIDHLCRNRACVNPRHLEQVTIQENTRRVHNAH